MKYAIPSVLLFTLFALICVAGCTSVPVDPTPKQTVIANAVEDALALGLVPVLTKNPEYVPSAAAVAAALGSFTGDTITPGDVEAVLSKTNIGAEDARMIAALVNAAWDTYSLRYSQQVNASVRPDVKLFLTAASNGIRRAIAVVPR